MRCAAENIGRSHPVCENNKICYVRNQLKPTFPDDFLLPQGSIESAIEALKGGECKVIAGRSQEVSEYNVRREGYDGENYTVEIHKNRRKIPFAYLTREDDAGWFDFVNWVVGAAIYAEDNNITRPTSMPLVPMFGNDLENAFRNSFETIGHYGEIFNRTIGSFVQRNNLSSLNTFPFGPQHYPWPGIGNNDEEESE